MSPDLDDGLNLSGFLYKLRKYWFSTLCIIVVSALVGCISYFILPKTYMATMTLKIYSHSGRSGVQIESNAVLIAVLKDEQFLQTLKKNVGDSVSKSPINSKTFIGRDLGQLLTINIIGRTADETKKIMEAAAHLIIERTYITTHEVEKLKENIFRLENLLKNISIKSEYSANLFIQKIEYELQMAQVEDAIGEVKIISTTDPSIPVSASFQKSLYLGLFAGILFAIGSLSLRRDQA